MTAREFADETGHRHQRWGDEDDVFAFAEAYAEAKLRAVSDALDGKPVTVFHVRELEYYLRSEVDEPIARIRAIVEGK